MAPTRGSIELRLVPLALVGPPRRGDFRRIRCSAVDIGTDRAQGRAMAVRTRRSSSRFLRITGVAMLSVSVALCVPGASGAAEPLALFGGENNDLFRAFDDGTGVTQVTDCAAGGGCGFANLSLSPSGQTAAFDVGTHRIDTVGMDGHARSTLIDDSVDYPTDPTFLPDSRSVAFTAAVPTESSSPACPVGSEINFSVMAPGYYDFNDDGLICDQPGTDCFFDAGVGTSEDIFSMPLYAPEGELPQVSALASGPGNERDPDFSADGALMVYSGQPAPGQPLKLMMASATGCNPQIVDTSSIGGDIYEPKLSPDGSKIVFYARPAAYTVPPGPDTDLEIWSVNVDGSDITRLTSNDTDDYGPNWSPDGQRIVYDGGGGYQVWSMAPDGSDAHRIFAPEASPDPSGASAENEGTYRTSSTFLDGDDYLAAQLRPIFLFDHTEHWRPLALSPFIREENPDGSPIHHVCDASGCTTDQLSDGLDRLREFPDGWIDIGVPDSTPLAYRSPREACTSDTVLYDCNSGSESAAYYQVAKTSSYTYLDFWLFYRYNDFSVDEHEGDWEGVTLGLPASDPTRFDFAAFAQHKTESTYLRSSLQCDEGGDGSCGSDADPLGNRLRVFVASGSHASYPGPCSDAWIPPTVCGQPDFPYVEANHDGEAAWGRNHDEPLSGAIFRFPPATGTWQADPASSEWVDWPGHWGATCAPDFDCPLPSPPSPGHQRRFKCPQEENVFDTTPCPPGARRATKAALSSRPSAPSGCATWFGADVVAAACAPTALRQAVVHGTLGRLGTFALRSRSRRFRAGSAPGLAQVMGQPLRPGDRLLFRGDAPHGTQLAVRAVSRKTLLEATFENLRRSDGAVVRVVGTGGDAQVIMVRRNGTRLRPRWTKRFKVTHRGPVRVRDLPRTPRRIQLHQRRRQASAAAKNEGAVRQSAGSLGLRP